MQTKLIIIHEVNRPPAKPGGATRTTVSPGAATMNGATHSHDQGPPAGVRRRPVSSACDSRRLVFVNWLPGRLIRCTGGMVAAALLVAGGTLRADTPAASFQKANAESSQGRNAEAAREFESVMAQNGFSAPALYNLANARLREGRIGLAILNYERAQTLDPRDPDIATNLKLARERAAGKAAVTEGALSPTRLLTLGGWGGLAATALLALCSSAVLPRLFRRSFPGVRLTAAVATVTFLTALSVLTLRWRELDRAIVIAADCPLRISPTSIGEQLFPLHEGDAVTLRKTRGEYALVQAQNGRSGWVKRGDIGRVYAATRK